MAISDYASSVKVEQVSKSQDLVAGTFTSTAIDTRGYYQALVLLDTGAFTGTVTSFKVQTSDASGGTYTDLTVDGVAAEFTATASSHFVGRVLCDGIDPFVKIEMVVATNPVQCAITVILMPYDSSNADTLTFAV